MRTLKVFLIIPLLVSCGAGIQVKKDSFKNALVISMEKDHDADLDEGFGSIVSRGSRYTREIANGVKGPIHYYFKLYTTPDFDSIKEIAYISVDGKVSEVKLSEISYSQQTNYSMVEKNSIVIEGKESHEVSVSQLKIISCGLSISPALEKEILNAKNLKYRLYSLSNSVTIEVSEGELEDIKKFIVTEKEES